MSEENKALVRRYFEEVWDKGNLEAIDELFTADFIRHGPTATEGEVRGLEGFKALVIMYRSAFPDLRVPIEDLLAEGERVVSRWRTRGTHQGELMGIAPSGNQASVTGIIIDRILSTRASQDSTEHLR
jgi:predicted ester cyclase